MTTKSKPPDGLGPVGRALWREILGNFRLDPGEIALLAAACRTADELGKVEKKLAASDVMVPGSTGQPVAHPLLAEARAHRKTLEGLIRALALPVDGESVGRVRSPQARDAARSRWRRASRAGLREVVPDGGA